MSFFKKNYFLKDTYNKLMHIINLSSSLAAFNTSLSDDEAYTKYYGDRYTKDKDSFLENFADNYRKIYDSSSKSRNYESLEKTCSLIEDDYNIMESNKKDLVYV